MCSCKHEVLHGILPAMRERGSQYEAGVPARAFPVARGVLRLRAVVLTVVSEEVGAPEPQVACQEDGHQHFK